jgi:hypothetical protein
MGLESTQEGPQEGFFAENFKSLIKAQREIEEVVEMLDKDSRRTSSLIRKQKQTLS